MASSRLFRGAADQPLATREPPPEVEGEKETHGPLNRRTEAILALAILTPVVATYGAISYGLYALVNSSL
jgi:hypothetical protein